MQEVSTMQSHEHHSTRLPGLAHLLTALLAVAIVLPLSAAARTTLSFQFEALPDSRIGSSSAEVQSGTSSVQVGHGNFQLGYSHSRYSWSDPASLPPALATADGRDPWEKLQRLSLGYRDRLAGPQWNTYYGVGISASYEQELDDSVSVFSYFMRGYNHSPDWESGLGVAVSYSSLKEYVLPMVFVRYRAPHQMGLSGSLGFPRTELRYRTHPQFSVGTRAAFGQGHFRLRDDSPLQPAGFVELKGYQAVGFAEYRLAAGTLLSLEASTFVERHWKIYDADGSRQGRVDLENGISTSLVWRQVF